jgi:hypothetical protein
MRKYRSMLISGLLAAVLLLGGCTAQTAPEETETTAAVPEENPVKEQRIFGAEMLTGAEIDALKEGKDRLPTGDERSVLYFNGA